MQKLKHHPAISAILEGGSVVQYGARTLNEGGFQVTELHLLRNHDAHLIDI